MGSNFCQLTLREQVQRAQALADTPIRKGLEGHTSNSPDNDIEVMAGELAGRQFWLEWRAHFEPDSLIFADMIEAARAIGIAQGLRLRPELFVKGGE